MVVPELVEGGQAARCDPSAQGGACFFRLAELHKKKVANQDQSERISDIFFSLKSKIIFK